MKTVLVTGGTTRLGKVIAGGLAVRGWRVLTSSHRADAGAELVADLSVRDEVDRLFDKAVELAGGRLDALVNNAALFAGESECLNQLNFDAPVRLMDRMREQGGAVVNVIDTRVLGDQPDLASVYARSKARLLRATVSMAKLSRPDFRVNGVAPGPVLVSPAVHEKAGPVPAGRPTPEDVASAVAFLLETASVTGAIIPVDGGQHLV